MAGRVTSLVAADDLPGVVDGVGAAHAAQRAEVLERDRRAVDRPERGVLGSLAAGPGDPDDLAGFVQAVGGAGDAAGVGAEVERGEGAVAVGGPEGGEERVGSRHGARDGLGAADHRARVVDGVGRRVVAAQGAEVGVDGRAAARVEEKGVVRRAALDVGIARDQPRRIEAVAERLAEVLRAERAENGARHRAVGRHVVSHRVVTGTKHGIAADQARVVDALGVALAVARHADVPTGDGAVAAHGPEGGVGGVARGPGAGGADDLAEVIDRGGAGDRSGGRTEVHDGVGSRLRVGRPRENHDGQAGNPGGERQAAEPRRECGRFHGRNLKRGKLTWKRPVANLHPAKLLSCVRVAGRTVSRCISFVTSTAGCTLADTTRIPLLALHHYPTKL